jgi:dual specificity phosphatase 12
MKRYNLKMETAFELVKSKRESIYPNEGFLDQLKIYEQLQCKVDMKSDLYKGFKNYISVNKSEQTIIYL